MGNLSDFQTILWPEVKASNVGFYRKPYSGFPSGSVIQAPFTRAGAGRKVIDASGNLVDAAANVPAWTFPIGGSSAGCPVLSFLPSVENLQRYSEDLTNNAAYVKSGNGAAQTSLISSPVDGVNYNEIYNNGGGLARVSFDATSIASTDQTISFFCKKKDETLLRISDNFAGVSLLNVIFNFDTGSFDTQSGTAYTDSGVVDFGSGNYFIWIELDTSVATQPALFLDSYTSGNGTYVTGVQVKEGSYISPLDYVKTEASAAPRAIDSITNISDLQGDGYLPSASEGAIMFQISATSLNDATDSIFRFNNFRFQSTAVDFRLTDTLNPNSVELELSQLNRVLIVFSSSAVSFYVNGFLAYSASGDYSTDSMIVNNSGGDSGVDIKMINFAPTALTASQAEAASSWPSRELMVSDLGYS